MRGSIYGRYMMMMMMILSLNDDDDDDWLCGEVFMEDIGDTWDWGHTGPFLFP